MFVQRGMAIADSALELKRKRFTQLSKDSLPGRTANQSKGGFRVRLAVVYY